MDVRQDKVVIPEGREIGKISPKIPPNGLRDSSPRLMVRSPLAGKHLRARVGQGGMSV